MGLVKLIKLIENKYNHLLIALIFAFLSEPFVGETIIGISVLFIIFFGIFLWTILLVIKALEHDRILFHRYLVLAGLAFCLKILGELDLLSSLAKQIINASCQTIFLFFIGMSIILILEEIFAVPTVTSDTIKGGVCIYFLIGFFWSILYALICSFNPTAFSIPMQLSDINYFSFTTLTTVGYGDIAPMSPVVRILANLEAIVGILYPTIFIARLIGLYSSEKK
ncbi:potassium channel family protein [Pantanalinema sp. GBBB05]|uniref:potassium channel family protein n=1 Tax=Pantanalinema sp. GBBB05 TaxID=2604139 RepID=UPI001D1C64C2|nr:two pore domain potassium channel family protein [Pantanalinema sp. GBBB05]